MKEESIRQETELEDAIEEAEALEESVPEQGGGAELSEEQKDNDLGFGRSISRDNARLINKDGTFNVRKINVGLRAINPYLLLVSMPWWKFRTSAGSFNRSSITLNILSKVINNQSLENFVTFLPGI